MNSIDIFIYSYKGKILRDVITTLKENSSKTNKINIGIVDQHPLDRKQLFKNELGCGYTHVFWDHQTTPMIHKNNAIRSSTSNYLMMLSDNVLLEKDWDIKLIQYFNEKQAFLSGNHSIELAAKNLFYIETKKDSVDNLVKTNFIDRSLVFASTELFRKTLYPTYLKYNGENEHMSLDLFTQGIDIFSVPTNTYTEVGLTALEEHYVPFSINHNYNEVVDLMHNGKNSYTDMSNRIRSVEDFSKFHNFDFLSINKLPFYTNDVSYSPENLNFNKVDARKFVARTKAIH